MANPSPGINKRSTPVTHHAAVLLRNRPPTLAAQRIRLEATVTVLISVYTLQLLGLPIWDRLTVVNPFVADFRIKTTLSSF
jgi:hypothetical protein